MTQEEKQLLVKALCGYFPYGIMCRMSGSGFETIEDKLTAIGLFQFVEEGLECIPYLRPLSSMTFEERSFCLKRGTIGYDENDKIFDVYPYGLEKTMEVIDFLNAHHFDYRGLIEKGLAIKAPEGMYKI